MPSHIYLAKANNDLVCHCDCAEALITFPPQMECPWCGCGWLFTCIECRKAFTFAVGVTVNESWEETATRDLTNHGVDADAENVGHWVTSMQLLLGDVEVGKIYVYLDGAVIPADVEGLELDGWHSHHELPFVPQVAALRDKSIVNEILSNKDYWRETAIAAAGEDRA